jgi:Protein of unknown function (DUF2630)
MDDKEIEARIDELVVEEERVWRAEARGDATDASRARLHRLKIALDACWDLLRRRRAAEEFGQNPDAVNPRDEEIVENYWQ